MQRLYGSEMLLRAREVHPCHSQPLVAPCEVVQARCNSKFCRLVSAAAVVPESSVKCLRAVNVFFAVVVPILGTEFLPVYLAQYVIRRRSVLVIVFHRQLVVVCLVLNHELAVYRSLQPLYKQHHQFSSKFYSSELSS